MRKSVTEATPSELRPGELALQVSDAWKLFGHVTALRGVSLEVRAGEVLAIVGDNGAGKSTLVKAMTGVYRLDQGTIQVAGSLVAKADPRIMKRLGLSAVFQDLALVETLDVSTNMFLGQPMLKWGMFRRKAAMYESAADTLESLKVNLPSVRIPIGELSGGQRQSVSIARAVLRNNPIVLLDEPTAALGVRETAQVGTIIDQLRDRHKAVILVSHDLEFVFAHADRIQVMRLGAVQGVRDVQSTNREEIVAMITGLVGDEER